MPPLTGDHQAMRDRLAQTVLDRIRNDQKRSEDEDVRNLLGYFQAHLFDRRLDVKSALRRCSIESSTFAAIFCAELGEKPQQYFISRRLEVGHILLLETNTPVYIVGLLIGYSSGQAFSQAFERAKGLRPKAYRAKYQKPDVPLDLDLELYERITHLNIEESRAIQEILQQRHPDLVGAKPRLTYRAGSAESYSLTEREVSDRTLDRLIAERFWSQIQGLEFSEQREAVFRERLRSPALFQLLKSKSLEESLVDREQGLGLARLALDAAIVAEPLSNKSRSCLQAEAWAWVGNEQRLQFNFAEAERCFQIAELLLPDNAPFAIQADILQLKANFRWFEDDLNDGLHLATWAVLFAEPADATEILSKALIVRGIILAHLGRMEEASEDYNRVIQISGRPEFSYSLMASFNLASCHWRQQNFGLAKEILGALQAILQVDSSHILWTYIKELEGRIALDEGLLDKSILKLSEAKQGFHAIKSKYAHIVGINLAIAHFLNGEPGKTFELVGKALDTVKVWRNQSRFEEVRKRLEYSTARKMVTVEDLLELRNLCDEYSHSPQTRSLLGLRGMI